MLTESLTNQYEINARLYNGQRLDVTKIVGATYILSTPAGDIAKTLDDMNIEYIDHLGDNYLVVTLNPQESAQAGTYPHQLSVSFDGSTYYGCTLRPAKLTFKPNIARKQ